MWQTPCSHWRTILVEKTRALFFGGSHSPLTLIASRDCPPQEAAVIGVPLTRVSEIPQPSANARAFCGSLGICQRHLIRSRAESTRLRLDCAGLLALATRAAKISIGLPPDLFPKLVSERDRRRGVAAGDLVCRECIHGVQAGRETNRLWNFPSLEKTRRLVACRLRDIFSKILKTFNNCFKRWKIIFGGAQRLFFRPFERRIFGKG